MQLRLASKKKERNALTRPYARVSC